MIIIYLDKSVKITVFKIYIKIFEALNLLTTRDSFTIYWLANKSWPNLYSNLL